ncbi:hypothetical protein NQZ68_015170 [Dissostichus eleginoides]|nr:hypothetical protein NQZ68_015170 [Dissostichus eleginoides]
MRVLIVPPPASSWFPLQTPLAAGQHPSLHPSLPSAFGETKRKRCGGGGGWLDGGQVESSPGSAVGPGLTLINLTCSPTPACPSLGTGAGARPASSAPPPSPAPSLGSRGEFGTGQRTGFQARMAAGRRVHRKPEYDFSKVN